MKQIFRSIILCSSLVAALTACSPEKKTETAKVKLSVNEQMQSDELTAAGEQLIAPHTFHLADRAFQLALEKNPTDKKAQFYRAFLKRFMVFRGIIARSASLVAKYGDVNEVNNSLKKFPNSPLRDFLTTPAAGATTLQTESDVQGLLLEYTKALQEFRQFVAANQDLKLDLYINPLMFMTQIQQNDQTSCTVVPGTTEEDGQLECDKTDIATIKVNIADLLVMKQEAAGEILFLTLYTSYNLNGVADLSKQIGDKNLSAKETLNLMQSKVDLKLMKGQNLTQIRELGADIDVAAKWAMKYQSTICPKDKTGTPVPRKGFLITSGICVDDADSMQKSIAALEQVLKGTMAITVGNEGATQAVKNLNILAPLDKPIKDLRTVAPASWNKAGTLATSFKDKTLGGLFPDRDADFLLIDNQDK